MELQEAIKILESIRNSIWVSFGDCRNKKILSEEEQEAIDTVLTELGRLQKANETLNSFIEWGTNPFVKEIKEGNNEQV